MIDDRNDTAKPVRQKPVATGTPENADLPSKLQVEKLKLVTNEEARLAAEIEKLRR